MLELMYVKFKSTYCTGNLLLFDRKETKCLSRTSATTTQCKGDQTVTVSGAVGKNTCMHSLIVRTYYHFVPDEAKSLSLYAHN